MSSHTVPRWRTLIFGRGAQTGEKKEQKHDAQPTSSVSRPRNTTVRDKLDHQVLEDVLGTNVLHDSSLTSPKGLSTRALKSRFDAGEQDKISRLAQNANARELQNATAKLELRERSDAVRKIIDKQEKLEEGVDSLVKRILMVSQLKSRVKKTATYTESIEGDSDDMYMNTGAFYTGPSNAEDALAMMTEIARIRFERSRSQGVAGKNGALSLTKTCDTFGVASRAWYTRREKELPITQDAVVLRSPGPGGITSMGHPPALSTSMDTELVQEFLTAHKIATEDNVSVQEGTAAEAKCKKMIQDPRVAGALISKLREIMQCADMVYRDAVNVYKDAQKKMTALATRVKSGVITKNEARKEAQKHQRVLKNAFQDMNIREQRHMNAMHNYEQVMRQVNTHTMDLHAESSSRIVRGVAHATKSGTDDYEHLQEAALARSSMNANDQRALDELSSAHGLDPNGTGQQLDSDFLNDQGFGELLDFLDFQPPDIAPVPRVQEPIMREEEELHSHRKDDRPDNEPGTYTVAYTHTPGLELESEEFEKDTVFESFA